MMEDRKVRIAINGLGRIGRQALKAMLGMSDDMRMKLSPRIDPEKIEVVAVNDLSDARVMAHLIRFDSIYGRYDREILVEHNGETIDWEGFTKSSDHMSELVPGGETYFVITGKRIRVFAEKDPHNIPWKELDIDVVIECTGVFTKYTDAKAHLEAGAKRVLISASAKGEEGVEGKTLVFGTEVMDQYSGNLEIFSNASCTTNCISPVLQVLESQFGIEKAMMSTVHAYTASQGLVDGPNKKDIREGRAGAINIIPAATGADAAVGSVLPKLKNSFDGMALRVPVPDGSIADITAILKTDVTVDIVQQAFIDAAETSFYKDLLIASREPLVSSDIIGNPASSIVDLDFIRVAGGNMVKVLAWYDNEWGYTNRLVEMAVHVARFSH